MKIEKQPQRIDNVPLDPFLDGPAEFLVQTICDELKKIQEWQYIFGEFIDPYQRLDYQLSNFPVLRVYSEMYQKQFESWWVTGQVLMDVVYPASIRRAEQQRIPDRIAAALLQQFRSPAFFDAVEKSVPGLNELGKEFSADKSLGFQWQDGVLPLTQISVNFRIDLREWDSYLESQCRTKDDPFNRTLAALKIIALQVKGMREDLSSNDINQEVVEITLGPDR